jgi:hypothetical protein
MVVSAPSACSESLGEKQRRRRASNQAGRGCGCVRVGVRVGRAGGRAEWAQRATHHAAAPPTPV